MLRNVQPNTLPDTNTFHNVGQKTLLGPILSIGLFFCFIEMFFTTNPNMQRGEDNERTWHIFWKKYIKFICLKKI